MIRPRTGPVDSVTAHGATVHNTHFLHCIASFYYGCGGPVYIREPRTHSTALTAFGLCHGVPSVALGAFAAAPRSYQPRRTPRVMQITRRVFGAYMASMCTHRASASPA
jgi:hypothetical protein